MHLHAKLLADEALQDHSPTSLLGALKRCEIRQFGDRVHMTSPDGIQYIVVVDPIATRHVLRVGETLSALPAEAFQQQSWWQILRDRRVDMRELSPVERLERRVFLELIEHIGPDIHLDEKNAKRLISQASATVVRQNEVPKESCASVIARVITHIVQERIRTLFAQKRLLPDTPLYFRRADEPGIEAHNQMKLTVREVTILFASKIGIPLR